MTFLTDRKLKTYLKVDKSKNVNYNSILSPKVPYIEKLLEISLIDNRKYAISLILAPYFVNILNLSDEESFCRIKQWILKCNDINPLKPSITEFDNIIKNAIKRAKDTGIKPLKFKDTLQYKNKKLYDMILSLKN